MQYEPTEAEIAFARGIYGFQADPCGFFTKVLGVPDRHIWSKMREVAESVRDNQFTAVPAGHSVSKTYGAGRIAVWFKTCFQPSTIITTAPTENIVKNQLWREIRSAYQSCRLPRGLGGKLTTLQWDARPPQDVLDQMAPSERAQWEKNFALGFSTSPDTTTETATRMQGWHNKWVFILLDEAGDILPPIWATVLQSLVTNKRCKVLAIGNPTNPYSRFADVCKMKHWNTIKISVRDTPNYKENREVIPGLAGRDYEDAIVAEFGENSNEHKVRCLGEFPSYTEGTVFGPEIGEIESRGWYGDYPWDRREPVYTCGDYGNIYTAIGFFQIVRDKIHMIDYFYDDVGMGIPGICKMFDSKPYIYGSHWISPDYDPLHGSNKKTLGTGKSVLSDFGRLGYHMNICESHSFDAGIKTARTTWSLTRIDKRCVDFWDSIKQYKFKKDLLHSTENKPAYSEDPQRGPSNHPADMIRYWFWIYRFQLEVDGSKVGSPIPLPVSAALGSDGDSIYDYVSRNRDVWG